MLLPVSELLFHTSLVPQAFMLLPLVTHRRDVASVSCILSLLLGEAGTAGHDHPSNQRAFLI